MKNKYEIFSNDVIAYGVIFNNDNDIFTVGEVKKLISDITKYVLDGEIKILMSNDPLYNCKKQYEIGDIIKTHDIDECRHACIALKEQGYNVRWCKAESFIGYEIIIVK